MSDPRHAERSEVGLSMHDGSLEPSSRFVPLADGRVARFDAGDRPASPVAEASAVPASRPNDMLAHARMLIDDLGTRFSEIERREQILASQLEQLDHERRELRDWKQNADSELRSNEEVLRHREATLAEQIASQQGVVEQLRSEQTDLAKRREQVEADRLRMLAEVGTKVAAERERLQQALAVADAEREAREIEHQRQQQLLDEAHQAKLRELDVAKSRVREDVTEEVLTAELRGERESLMREIAAFDKARQEFVIQRDRERSDLEHAREVHTAAVARLQEDLLAQRQQQLAELESAKLEQTTQLNEAQEAFARQREQQLTELRHERAVLENRLRFQQEHLAKARQEIESAQNEFRREAQRARGQLEEGESIIRLRQSQLDRVRSLLEERERSVNREREMLLKSQRAFEQSTEHDRERMQLEREGWDREYNAQQADLRRQQDMLALHANNLEGRRERLDKLRAELEETHRTTLEMRMAIEEAWAQMTQACGVEVAQQRLDQAQQQLSGHYRGLRDALIEQRRELDELRQAFQTQRDEFRAEQQTLSEWAASQERSQRDREASLQTQAEQLNVRESAWRSASQRWINEKIEAEAIIRDLLEQLTSLTEPTSPVSMWPRPTMPVYDVA